MFVFDADYELCNVELEVLPFGQSHASPAMVNESTSMLPSSADDCTLVIGSNRSSISQVLNGCVIVYVTLFRFLTSIL